MEILTGLVFPIIISVVGIVVGAIVGFYGKKAEKKVTNDLENTKQEKERYEKLLKDEQARNFRNMIVEEIEPIADELVIIKTTIEKKTKEFEECLEEKDGVLEGKVDKLLEHHDSDKAEFDAKLKELTAEYEDKLKRILESYKFRFIQLCKTHIKDGWITDTEWEQIVTFYDLYHGLGGNGQAEEYYNKVKQLEIVRDGKKSEE